MPSVLGVGDVGSAGSIDQLIQAASTPPGQPAGGGFRKILGGVIGGAANIFMPGMGSVIGNIIGGGGAGGSVGGFGNMTPASMLQMQEQVQMEQLAFTTASTIMKDRHDAAMEAIRNAKSS